MKRILLFVVFIFGFLGHTIGQSQKSDRALVIMSHVRDNVTRESLKDSKVFLLSVDSVLLDSTMTYDGSYRQDGHLVDAASRFDFKIKTQGTYILLARHNGYEDNAIKVKIDKIYKRELYKELEPILLQKTILKNLEGITVTATKLKFYNRGDTLIYNADAFNLAEGSMLDALIRQLPGAELKDDGRIYVNGRFVESLLLNGKDFFKGNNQIMLDNLPTYMVQNVKVYDKLGNRSEFLGGDAGDKEYVMDVRLKKQYNTGWVGNVEGGVDTKNLWLARLFAMRFTDHSQLAFYGNMNNTNDSRKPGQNSDWTPEKMPTGQVTTKMAGLDYSVNDKGNTFKLNGNAQFKYTDSNTETQTNKTNFLSGGNTYDRILNTTKYENLELSTRHNLYFDFKSFDLTLAPRFNYEHHKGNGDYYSATASEEWSVGGKEWLDSLFVPNLSINLRNSILNRNIQRSRKDGYSWSGAFDFYSDVKVKHTSDALQFSGWVALNNAGDDNYKQSRIDYLSENQTTVDYRNLYSKTQPGRGYDMKIKGGYFYRPVLGLYYVLSYGYRKRYEVKHKDYYRLDQLDDWNTDNNHEIGELPSEREYLLTQDYSNSYFSRLYEDTHEVTFNFYWDKFLKKGRRLLQVDIPLGFVTQRFKYQRKSKDTAFTRHTVLPEVKASAKWTNASYNKSLYIYYQLTSKSPDLIYLADYQDSTDPLNVYLGNADLKNQLGHKIGLNCEYSNSKTQFFIFPFMSWTYTQNAIAMGYLYDKQSGRKTTTPANVNGNWEGTVGVNVMAPVGKAKKLTIRNYTYAIYNHSVDLTGVEGMSQKARSTVKTLNLTEATQWEYKLGVHTLSAKATFSWLRSTSALNAFETINAYNYNYGLIGNFKLPCKLELNTDLTMYSRRGYEDSEMNSDDLVWNARLSYPMMKGKLRLMLDGFDIFHQLSNIQRYINAQGRTEVRTNVIPRYVMLHAVYRLNIMPKKK